jgi:hypothetical protein
MAEIAAILDWRGALELGRPQLLLDVPMRTTSIAARGREAPRRRFLIPEIAAGIGLFLVLCPEHRLGRAIAATYTI